MKYLNRNKKFEFVKNDLFGTHNCLDENEETLFEAEEELHKINDYLRKRGIVYSNFITSNKPQEYEISIIFNLKKEIAFLEIIKRALAFLFQWVDPLPF